MQYGRMDSGRWGAGERRPQWDQVMMESVRTPCIGITLWAFLSTSMTIPCPCQFAQLEGLPLGTWPWEIPLNAYAEAQVRPMNQNQVDLKTMTLPLYQISK